MKAEAKEKIGDDMLLWCEFRGIFYGWIGCVLGVLKDFYKLFGGQVRNYWISHENVLT